jgi:hypothetical protein
MKTKLQLPTVQFKEIEIDLDELENFCETQSISSLKKDFWYRLSGEIHRYKAGKSYRNYLEEFLEGVYFFLKSVYPDVYEEYFDPYFEYEEGHIDTQLCKIIQDMKDLNE